MLQGLFEAGIEPPVSLVGVSVGALNGSCIAAYPSPAGVMMLRELWMSRQALDVFHAHPLGVILSGLLATQAPAAIAAYRAQGLALEARVPLGEWVTLVLRRRNER